MRLPPPATRRTLYLIGSDTAKAAVMRMYPHWAGEVSGLDDTELKGIDLDPGASVETMRRIIYFIKNDPLSMGAMVATQKAAIYEACRDMFDFLDPYAILFGKISVISKNDGWLEGHDKDPVSSRLALKSFVPQDFWLEHGGEVFIMGAGNSAAAIGACLIHRENGRNLPAKITVCNRSMARLEGIKETFADLNPNVPAQYYLSPSPEINDIVLNAMKPYSLVVNATGKGEGQPGAPVTRGCGFPGNSLVWDLSIGGERDFLQQALAQKENRNLTVEDGRDYFIHTWAQVIAQAFHIPVTYSSLAACARFV